MHLRDQLQRTLGTAFTLERELGGGGMSRVFVAEETALHRKVVLKILPSEMAGQVSIERFQREIALAAKLQHPHIVPLIASGDAGGLPYFTMPFVEGESLRARLAKGGELPLGDAVRLLREVASALAYAHERGVVHRDIKPDNVLLSGGIAMVTDFGVAKALSASSNADKATLTSLGVALGTPAYMSPEQASADPHIDHRADLYAFGVMAYEVLTGQPPFAGRPPQAMLAAHVSEVPHAVTERRATIPTPLAQLVMRCLEKRAADRPQSAQEVIQVLDAITTPSGGMTPTGMLPAAARRGARRAILVSAAAVVVVAAALLGWRRLSREHEPLDPAHVVVLRPTSAAAGPSTSAIAELLPDVLSRGVTQMSWVTVANTSESAARPGTPDYHAAARDAGAGTVVATNLLASGDSVLLQFRVADGTTGQVVRTLAPVTVPRQASPERLLAASDAVLTTIGFVTNPMMGVAALPLNNPPKSSAFREFEAGLASFGKADTVSRNAAIAHLRRAITLDSSFAQARLWLAFGYVWYFFTSRAPDALARSDTVRKWTGEGREALTPYENSLADVVRAFAVAPGDQGVQAVRRLVQLNPASPAARALPTMLLDRNRPREAVRALEELHARHYALNDPVRGESGAGYWPMIGEIQHYLGAHKEELSAWRRARADAPTDMTLLRGELCALAALGDMDGVRRGLDEVGSAASNDRAFGFAGDLYLTVGQELLAHGHAMEGKEVLERGRTWFEGRREQEVAPVSVGVRMAITYDVLGRAGDAFATVNRMMQRDSLDVRTRGLLGRFLVDRRDSVGVARTMAWLKSQPAEQLGGTPTYERAAITVRMGRAHWDEAIALLEESLRQGEGYGIRRRLHYFSEWLPLRDFPPFQRVIRPRG